MSTRSHIGLKENDGVKWIYCHHDGYIDDGVGETLFKHYTTTDNITRLLCCGDLISLENTPEESNNNSFNTLRKEDTTIKFDISIDMYVKHKLDAEYLYVFDNGEWRCYIVNDDRWVDLKSYFTQKH